MSRADADEIASALGLALEYDADYGVEALKEYARVLASEHAALRNQVAELRNSAERIRRTGESVGIQRGVNEERRRCLAWVEYIGTRRVARDGGPRAEVAIEKGIKSGEWPPEDK